MRTPAFVVASSVVIATIAVSPGARAQVTDAERSAARELFKEGDELQRAGKLAEALDKFQSAQKVYSAPTNELRIAECQAGLGQLVESTESYRAVVRMALPPGSPPAFQSAVDQAKVELAQVEPRVPKLIVQVTPGSSNPQMQIDGQTVSAALLGEPLPLDPGAHRVRIAAEGFTTSEQNVMLKERETSTLLATLKPSAAVAPAAAPLPPSLVGPAPPPQPAATVGNPPGAPPPYVAPPPPPPTYQDKEMASAGEPSRVGLLLGGHLGWEIGTGQLPVTASTNVPTGLVASGGAAYAVDAGLRFATHWYIGATLEHAEMMQGDLSSDPTITAANASTTALGAVFAFISNPERASFYGEIGAASRWLSFSETVAGVQRSNSFNSGELMLGAGLWLPVARVLRLLPKLTVGLGSFNPPGADSAPAVGHAFWMLGLSAYYNLDF